MPDFLTDPKGWIIEKINEILEPVWDQLTSLWGRVQTDYFVLNQRINMAYEDMATLETQITGYVDTSIASVGADIQNVADDLQGDLTQLGADLTTYIDQGVIKLESDINASIQTLSTEVNTRIDGVASTVQGISDDLTDGLADLEAYINTGLSNLEASVTTIITTIQNEVNTISDMLLDPDGLLDLFFNALDTAWGD